MTAYATERFDKAEVKDRCRGQWPAILSAAGIAQDLLDGRHHACPKCGGVDRFRLIDAAAGAVRCNGCFAERCGDGLAAIQWIRGCSFPEALRFAAAFVGMVPQNGHANGQPVDPLDALCRSKRMPVESAKAYGARAVERNVVFPSWGPDGTPRADFTICPMGTDRQRKGLWPKGGKAGVFLPVVEGWPNAEVAAPRLPQPGETWIVCEGVKDAAALHGLGYNALGMPTCKLSQKAVKLLRGVNVVLIPDRDTAGIDGAEGNARKLYGVAASVAVANLPAEVKESGGADVRDILAQEDGEQAVREAIDEAQPWQPPKAPDDGSSLSLVKVENRTDVENGRRFIREHGELVRYVGTWEKWLGWDGRRWRQDEACAVEALAKRTTDKVWEEILRVMPTLDAHTVTALASWGKYTASTNGIAHMLTEARSEPGIVLTHDDLDRDPWLLNVQNGTLDLRTGKILPHNRTHHITKVCPVSFDPDAEAPRWRRFVSEIMAGDAELVAFLRRLAGYWLTGSVREHCLPIFYGSGANGKSVFLNTLLAMLGADYGMTAPPDLLMVRKHASHPTERADLFGKRLVCCIEAEAGCRLAESLVKALTGGERVRARRMCEDFWEFPPTHKLAIAANHKPGVSGHDHGIWRRLALVPFNVRYWDAARGESGPESLRQDKRLSDALLAELPGILNWCLLGCAEWQAEGLAMPASVQSATDDYRGESDNIAAFIAECCLLGSNMSVGATPLFTAYVRWCEDNHERAAKRNDFAKYLTTQGFEEDRFTFGPNKGKAKRNGIGLRASEASEVSAGRFPYARAQGNRPDDASLTSPDEAEASF